MKKNKHINYMKEQDLIDLEFERVDVTAEESGDDAFYYYTYDLCLLYTSPSPRDRQKSRMPSSA